MAFATSTFSRLPEELLDEILHEVLTLPRMSFLGWTHCGTYGCKPTSIAADVLRVSKTWARVGQRHLYEGVIIRRKAQAKSLAQTLVASAKGVSNSRFTLAQRIRRLRIDRVQCGDVKVILKLATMVVDFHISLDVPQAARPLDWLPGFQRMSPRRLYIQGTPQGNKNNERLVKAIEEVVMSSTEQLATWKRLVRPFPNRLCPTQTADEAVVLAPCRRKSICTVRTLSTCPVWARRCHRCQRCDSSQRQRCNPRGGGRSSSCWSGGTSICGQCSLIPCTTGQTTLGIASKAESRRLLISGASTCEWTRDFS